MIYPQIQEYKWIRYFDGSEKTILGTPTFAQSYSIIVQATDPYGGTAASILEIKVRINGVPRVSRNAFQVTLTQGISQEVSLPTLFSDPDLDILTYTFETLP